MSKKLTEENYIEYRKMRILREVAKNMPDSQLAFTLKSVDRQWDEIIKPLQPPKKKKSFVTKF